MNLNLAGGWRAHVRENPYLNYSLEIFLSKLHEDGSLTTVEPDKNSQELIFKKHKRHEARIDTEKPTMSIDSEMGQALMDGLWKARFRPNEGRRYEEEADLLKNHLNDMRKIVFKEKESDE